MMFIIFDLFGDLSKLMEAKAPLAHILLYYLCILAPTLEYITPASLLLATLYTLWNLSKNNELLAMRTSGLSFYTILRPFLLVGLLFSLTNIAVAELIAPPAQAWSQSFKDVIARRPREKLQFNTAYYNTHDHRLWTVEEFDLNRPAFLKRVKITEERANGTRIRDIRASKAQWLDEQWWLFEPTVQSYDESDNPVGQPVAMATGRGSVVEMTSFAEYPIDFVNEVRAWEILSPSAMWNYIARHPGLSREAMARKLSTLHSRLAMPWACLIVTLFAVPTGARTGRQSALVGVVRAVAFFFAFYAMAQFGLFLGIRQVLDPWAAAWLPNLAFLATGIVMVVRMR
jgi:lipopolysaccharide export system permease protein